MKICITCEGISEIELEHCAHCQTRLLSTGEVHFPLRRGEEDAGHPLVGQVVDGKYRLLNVVGKGGMGTVFRAEHEISQVPVAVKVLHPRHAARADHRAWFLAEARKAGRVVHDHSARILDVGETVDGTVFIAMELVHGVNLSSWIDGAPVPVDVAVDVLAQMARALSAAHQAGVVHRDLTSRNVMVSMREGRPFIKILDFGIAKGAGVFGGSSGDPSPIGFATPPYSAPEHLEGQDVDARADLYSLGVIAFEMLAGRSPVHGATATELIQATLDGELDVPRSIPGVPSELLALVVSLLARLPDDRPSSAQRVAVRLEQMLEPRGRHLAVVAVVMAVLVALAFALWESPRTTVGLVLTGDASRFALFPFQPLAPVVQELRAADLQELRFKYRGFDPRRLEVVVRRRGEVLWRATLGAREADRSGELLLTMRSPDYQGFVDRLAETSLDDFVDLEFVTADGDSLGFARVVIDDRAPLLHLEIDPADTDVTRAARLRLDVTDSGTISEYQLVVELQSPDLALGAPPHPLRHSFDPSTTELDVSVFDVLGSYYAGVEDFGQGQMWLEARDRAGNQSQSGHVFFGALDLRAPEILVAPLGGNELTYQAEGVRLRVRLSAPEEDLEFRLRGPGGQTLPTKARQVDGVYELDIAYGEDRLFGDGAYLLSLKDRYGNRSAEHAMNLHFRSAVLTARLSASVDREHVFWLHDQLDFVTDGAAITMNFTCSDLYTPTSLSLSGRRDDALSLMDAGPGHATVKVGVLPDGLYRLEMEFASEQSEDAPQQSYAMRVLRSQVELRLPEVRGQRYLRELANASVLKVVDGKVNQGPSWRLVPPDARLLRGWFWVGDPPNEKIPLPLRSLADADLLEGFELRRGLNCISVEVRDVFDRPMRVFHSDRESASQRSASGGQIQELLRFYDHDAPIEVVDPVLRVEHGQDTLVVIRSALPFRAGDLIELRAAGASLAPDSLVPVGDGALLSFVLPFAQVAVLPEVGGALEERFVGLQSFALPVRLRCPAGEFPLSFTVQPIRSSLVPVRLGAVGLGAPDPALAGIWMVPIPGLPESGEYPDPVPADVGHRRTFRLSPETTVRNIGDYFLQKGELTRGQYLAIVRGALDLPSLRDRWQQYVHLADTLGQSRLTREALVPRIYAGDDEAWQRACRIGAERPVTGVDFFQAYTVTRLAGDLLGGDPSLFRLPTGIELEYAAFGVQPVSGALRLHRSGVSAVGFHAASLGLKSKDSARWPLTSAELEEIGDVVFPSPEPSMPIIGLDFGVREWVIDLPFAAAAGDAALARRTLMREWLGEHARLVRRAEALAQGTLRVDDLPADLATHFSRFGVVRGLATGEVRGLKSGFDGRTQAWKRGKLEAEVPGCVRELTIRRDGSGLLPGRLDRHLHLCGFRLAGGSRFIGEVRKR